MTAKTALLIFAMTIVSSHAWYLIDRIDLEILSGENPVTDLVANGSRCPSDPYVWVTYGEHDAVGSGTNKFPIYFGQTSVKHDSSRPVWREHMRYDKRAATHPFRVTSNGYLRLALWDKDVTYDDFVGQYVIDLQSLTRDNNGTETYVRLSPSGALTYTITVWLDSGRELPIFPTDI